MSDQCPAIEEFKESIIQKMMPPNNVPVSQRVCDTGISDVTLYTWRKKALSQAIPVPGRGKIQISGHWWAGERPVPDIAAKNEPLCYW